MSTIPTGMSLLRCSHKAAAWHGAGWGLEPEQFLGELIDLRVRHLPEAAPRRMRVSTPRSGAHAVIGPVGRTAGRSRRTHRTRTRTDARSRTHRTRTRTDALCIGPGSQAVGLLCGGLQPQRVTPSRLQARENAPRASDWRQSCPPPPQQTDLYVTSYKSLVTKKTKNRSNMG